jgi:hypothetical protein
VTDENKLIRDNGRALRAQSLLENEMLTEAFKTLEDGYMTAWRATFIDDISSREKLFLAINVVGKVRDHLTKVVTHGKIAQAELDEIARVAERERERKKRFGIL